LDRKPLKYRRTMSTDELLKQIPSSLEYSFTVQRLGYHYSCYLKIINGKQTAKFDGSSNDFDAALTLISERLRRYLASGTMRTTA